MAAWQVPDTFPDVNQLNNGEQVTESTPCAPGLFNFLVRALLFLGEDTPLLGVPQNISISGTTLSWDSVNYATSYDIYADNVLIGNTAGGNNNG